MSPAEIACPICHGEGVLDCSAGCPGNDPRCLTCSGRGPERCECWDGVIPQPAYCPLCLEDGYGKLGESNLPEWEEHEVLSAARLDRALADGRLSLADCKARLCAYCSAATIGQAGGAS